VNLPQIAHAEAIDRRHPDFEGKRTSFQQFLCIGRAKRLPRRQRTGTVVKSAGTELRTTEVPMHAVLPYRAMAYNNGWANHRLLTACMRLSQADFVAPRTGFFPSLRATLNHILIIDRFYVDAMEGGTLGPAAFADPEPCETATMLKDAQRQVDRRLIAVVERLGTADLDRVVDIHRGDRIQRERIDRLLLHLFQHQVHHRGQAHAMLSATEVQPPQLDEFFAAGEAPLRAAEFAELGWTEDTVWSNPVTAPAGGRR
jgi:uncharacterized damage-inducible protein DinB